MPPGPRKRRRRRQTENSPGFSLSADESHESDETISCPGTPNQRQLTFSSLDTPSDQKSQIEEWVRISDFNVGTPTSTTADSKADYGVVALDKYGDVRGHDKHADWKTVPRDMVGMSSTEDVVENMQGNDSVVDESIGPSQGQGLDLSHVDNGNLERLSEKQVGEKKASSSRTSQAQDKMRSNFEAHSPRNKEDQEAASSMECQETVQVNGGSEVSLQQEHDNERQKSPMEVHPQKLKEQEEALSNGNKSLPKEEEEDHHVTNPRQENSTIIGHALEEDRSIQAMDATKRGMDESVDQSTEAVDVAPLEQQEHNVKEISEQENDRHDQLLDIAHSAELASLGKQEEKIIAQEEEDIREDISEPIADMPASFPGPLPQLLQHSEVEDLQKVAIAESPVAAPDAVESEAAEPSITAQESALEEQFSISNEDSFTDAIPGQYENMHLSDDLSMTAKVEKDSPTQRIIAPGSEYYGPNENKLFPYTPDREKQTLSLLDTPSDTTLQTEDWVKILDFDVCTPTSTNAHSRVDYNLAAEKSYGDVRVHDKLADWETVSRDTVGASSIEEVEESLEGNHLAFEESVSSSQGRGLELPHVDKGDLECLSDNQGSHETVSLSSQSLSEVSEIKENISNCTDASSPGKEDQEAASVLQFQANNQESGSPEVPLQPDNEKEITSTDVQSQKLQGQREPEGDHHVTNLPQEYNMILSNSLEEGGSMQAADTTTGGVDKSGGQSIDAVDFIRHEPQEDNRKGISEQENDELDQLADIAESTELASLGKQEEKIIAQEEEDLGKTILEPLANVLVSAETLSETLQLGEMEDLQDVAVEETPLVQDSSDAPDAPDAAVSEETEPSSTELESALGAQLSGAVADSFTHAIPREYQNPHLLEDLSITTAGHPSQIDAPLAEMENYDLIAKETAPGPTLPLNFSTDRTDDADLGKGLSIGGSGSSPEALVHYSSPKKTEGQVSSREHSDGSSEIRGCCEPVHWILAHVFGRQMS